MRAKVINGGNPLSVADEASKMIQEKKNKKKLIQPQSTIEMDQVKENKIV